MIQQLFTSTTLPKAVAIISTLVNGYISFMNVNQYVTCIFLIFKFIFIKDISTGS